VLVLTLLILPVRYARKPFAPPFVNDSGRQHEVVEAQTWARFAGERRSGRNSGRTVKLGNGTKLGIVGESFHLDVLMRVKAQYSVPGALAENGVRSDAYLIGEPENPYSPKDAVRVESPSGRTIEHLSAGHAAEYVGVS